MKLVISKCCLSIVLQHFLEVTQGFLRCLLLRKRKQANSLLSNEVFPPGQLQALVNSFTLKLYSVKLKATRRKSSLISLYKPCLHVVVALALGSRLPHSTTQTQTLPLELRCQLDRNETMCLIPDQSQLFHSPSMETLVMNQPVILNLPNTATLQYSVRQITKRSYQ